MDPQGWLDGKNLARSRVTEHEKVANCNISAISLPHHMARLAGFSKESECEPIVSKAKTVEFSDSECTFRDIAS
jgi:hypothetical protein